jgi:NAD(P)-dependent dehydrogenase (short-subunit alcohol dehydrogenase family)
MASTYLVTGASRGLGAEFVKQLCGQDHRVLAAMRDPKQGDVARRAGATVVQLDVDRRRSMRSPRRSTARSTCW